MDWLTTSTILDGLHTDRDEPWRVFVGRFHQPIVRFARSLGLPAAEAEDVAQETLTAFLTAYRSGKYDRNRGRLSKWLFGIAWRQTQRQRQRSARQPVGIEQSSFWQDVPDEQTAGQTWDREWRQAVLEHCLKQARSEVEPATFAAFEAAVKDDRPAGAIAEQLGISVKAVYNAKHRVLKRLRELQEEFEMG